MSDRSPWQGAADWIAQQIGEAATDIRRRVVEEGWFGKPQDGPGVKLDAPSPAADDGPASAWDWAPDPRAAEAMREPAQERAVEPPSPAEPDRGIDF